MKNFKKDLACNITLICVLAFSFVHLLMLTLNLFGATNFALPSGFSYITAYILMIFCFALYILGFWIENLRTLKIPTWFKMTFYIAFFIFTNVYYILGLYQNFIFMLIFVAFIAAILNVFALSIYFNISKDDKNKLKASTKMLVFNTTTYSVALCSLALFIISIAKVLFGATYIVGALLTFVIEMSVMLQVCAIFSVMFAISHKKTKRIINGSLIKVIQKTISPSVKSNG